MTSFIVYQQEKCEMFAIGIGDYVLDELLEITGKVSSNIITKDKFADFNTHIGNITLALVKKSCI